MWFFCFKFNFPASRVLRIKSKPHSIAYWGLHVTAWSTLSLAFLAILPYPTLSSFPSDIRPFAIPPLQSITHTNISKHTAGVFSSEKLSLTLSYCPTRLRCFSPLLPTSALTSDIAHAICICQLTCLPVPQDIELFMRTCLILASLVLNT